MNKDTHTNAVQYSFVVPSFPGEDAIEGFEFKALLLNSLIELQKNPALPTHLQEEAGSVQYILEYVLKQVWVKSFEDEEETKPKEIAFELESLDKFDFDKGIRQRQQSVLAQLKEVIDKGEATEEHLQDYQLVLEMADSPIIDTDQIARFAASLVYETFGKESVLVAMQMALLERSSGKQPTADTSISRLFPNSKTIDLSREFGLAKSVADNLVKIIKDANRETAIQQYEKSGEHPRSRKPIFRTTGRENNAEFIFDRERLAITTAEQFADQLIKVRDAKVLQTFFALIKYANMQDAASFYNVPISEVMELILKANGASKFNTPQRKEFSQILEYLASISITVSVIGDQINPKTGKPKPVLREEKGVKIFRMIAEYSVKREYQSIPKESLIPDIHFDRTVITRFSGELLPGNSQLFRQRANVYFDELLHFDANKDSKAILMGFTFQTRFNQLDDKTKPIEWDRASLIDLCDYEKTDKTKPSQATKQLANNLDKLKKAGIISSYSGLTNSNSDRVRIFPPKGKVKAIT